MRMMFACRARAPYVSIISTIGAPFLSWRPLCFLSDRSISENCRAASRTLLVLFGGAPDAPDARLLRLPKPRKDHAVPLGEGLSSCPHKMSAFPMPSRAPLTRNGGPMMQCRGHRHHPRKQALASVPPRPDSGCILGPLMFGNFQLRFGCTAWGASQASGCGVGALLANDVPFGCRGGLRFLSLGRGPWS